MQHLCTKNVACNDGVYCIVGWVEVTKPFGYAQGNAQQATKLVLGFARAQPNLQLLILDKQ